MLSFKNELPEEDFNTGSFKGLPRRRKTSLLSERFFVCLASIVIRLHQVITVMVGAWWKTLLLNPANRDVLVCLYSWECPPSSSSILLLSSLSHLVQTQVWKKICHSSSSSIAVLQRASSEDYCLISPWHTLILQKVQHINYHHWSDMKRHLKLKHFSASSSFFFLKGVLMHWLVTPDGDLCITSVYQNISAVDKNCHQFFFFLTAYSWV